MMSTPHAEPEGEAETADAEVEAWLRTPEGQTARGELMQKGLNRADQK